MNVLDQLLQIVAVEISAGYLSILQRIAEEPDVLFLGSMIRSSHSRKISMISAMAMRKASSICFRRILQS